MRSITLEEYLNGFDRQFYCDEEVKRNATDLLTKVNWLISTMPAELADNLVMSSGWRPDPVNLKTPGASRTSKHIKGLAIDFDDDEGEYDDWLMDNLVLLEAIGLYLEHPSATKGWAHLQSVPPKSGKRVFYP